MRPFYPGRVGIWSVGFCGEEGRRGEGGGSGEVGEKPSEQGENQQQTRATLSGGERFHQPAIPAPLNSSLQIHHLKIELIPIVEFACFVLRAVSG